MYCNKCGRQSGEGQTFCEYCGINLIEAKRKLTSKNSKRKKIIIASICSVIIAVVVVVFFVVLPMTGNDFWKPKPAFTIERYELEAGKPVEPLDLIRLDNKSDRTWEVRVKETDLDTSILGTYFVIYNFVSEDIEYDISVSYKVTEGEFPKIKLTKTKFEYSQEEIIIENYFQFSDLKDYIYEIDDSKFDFETLGTYHVYVRLYNSRNEDETFEFEIEVVDTQPPEIWSHEVSKIMQGEEFDFTYHVFAKDNYDGDLDNEIELLTDLDTNIPGTYELVFSVTDSAGNSSQTTYELRVAPIIEIGEEIEINNFTIKVNEWYFAETIGDKDIGGMSNFESGQLYIFLVVNVDVINNGNQEDIFGAVDDRDEISYINGIIQNYYGMKNDITDFMAKGLEPGEQRTGNLYFEVEQDLQDSDKTIILEIESNTGADAGRNFYWILRK